MSRQVWIYNGLSLSSWGKWDVEEVIEGIGLPKYRGNDIQVPFYDGKRWIKKRFDSRRLILAMWIKGKDKRDLDQNIDSFLKVVGMSGTHTLQRVMRNGEIRTAQAELISGINFVVKNPGYAKFALELELSDPFFYGSDLITDEYVITDINQTIVIENPGTAPITKVKITLNGPMDSPKITNAENKIWLQYQRSISSGESIIINTNDYSCLKDGDNYISALAHGGDPRWLILESGNNQLEIEAGTTDGSIAFEYYPAYF